MSLLLFSGNTMAQLEPGVPNSTREIRFYDAINEPYAFSDDSSYFIIVKNYRSCIQCFTSLDDFIAQTNHNARVSFIAASTIDSTALERKKHLAANRRLMPSCNNYLFIYEANSSLRTNQYYTPEVIMIIKGRMEWLHYADIFLPGTTEISEVARSRFSQLLIE